MHRNLLGTLYPKDEARIRPLRVIDEKPIVIGQDIAGNRETETRSFATFLAREEGFEDLVSNRFGNTLATIGNADPYERTHNFKIHSNPCGRFALDGVVGIVQEIHEDLLELLVFKFDLNIRNRVEFKVYSIGPKPFPTEIEGFIDNRLKVATDGKIRFLRLGKTQGAHV